MNEYNVSRGKLDRIIKVKVEFRIPDVTCVFACATEATENM